MVSKVEKLLFLQEVLGVYKPIPSAQHFHWGDGSVGTGSTVYVDNKYYHGVLKVDDPGQPVQLSSSYNFYPV